MTSISYDEIFSHFLGNITDYQLASLNIDDANILMVEWLNKTLAEPYVSSLFSDIVLDDEVQLLTYTMDVEINENIDKIFTLNILSKGMTIQWLEPQVKSKLNIAQYFGSKERTFFSQSNHIAQLRGMLEDTRAQMEKLITDRQTHYNSYLKESLV